MAKKQVEKQESAEKAKSKKKSVVKKSGPSHTPVKKAVKTSNIGSKKSAGSGPKAVRKSSPPGATTNKKTTSSGAIARKKTANATITGSKKATTSRTIVAKKSSSSSIVPKKKTANARTVGNKKTTGSGAPVPKKSSRNLAGKTNSHLAANDLAEVLLIIETACQTGAWLPTVSVNDEVGIADTLGTVVFSGIPCEVFASEKGVISWIRTKSQVNAGMNVCKIMPDTEDDTAI